METNVYPILVEKQEEVNKKLKRLQKKAEKYNVPFSASYGEPYVITKKQKNEFEQIVENHYEVVDLTLTSDVIRKDGYTVIAYLEHANNGNIVNVFVGDVQKEWVTMPPFCEHCNANHNLRHTFIVDNGKEQKQVGRTCLKEYCGIDPQVIGMVNAFYGEIEEYTTDGFDFSERIPLVYDSVHMLAHAIDITAEQGYVKSDEYNSNKSYLIKHCNDNPKQSGYDKALEMAKAIMEMPLEVAIDNYLNNVQVRLQGMYCKPTEFGYFAYAPTAYAKYLERKAREERRLAENKAMSEQSDYVGTVGERISIDVKEATLITTYYGQFGVTYIYRFIDTNDNVLMWFASSTINTNVEKIKATIKDHKERGGVKQTIITRVKEVA